MKTLLTVGLVAALFILLVSQWNALTSLSTPERLIAAGRHPIVGETAPGFDLQTLDGDRITLEDYAGRALIIGFWATWCQGCKKDFPVFETFVQTHDEKIGFLSICSEHSPEKAQEIVAEHGVTFPVLYDEGKVVARAYQPQSETARREVTAFPFVVIIDPGGTVIFAHVGIFATIERLVDLLAELGLPVDARGAQAGS